MRGIKAWSGLFDPNSLYDIITEEEAVLKYVREVSGATWQVCG
jgi:hypothetical protein